MFGRLGSFAYRRRRWVLSGSVLFVLVAALMGTGVFGRLGAGGFADPSAESTRAKDVLESRFGTGAPNLVLLVDAKAAGSSTSPAVDSPAVERAANSLAGDLAARSDVADVASYWSLGKVAPL